MSAISRYERRVYGSLVLLVSLAALGWPAWGMGRADRVWGLALGIAAGVLRLRWTFFLARRLGGMTRTRYAAARAAGFVPLAAALAAAGIVDGIGLYAAAAGVLLPTGASIVASVLELRAIERRERAALVASDPADRRT